MMRGNSLQSGLSLIEMLLVLVLLIVSVGLFGFGFHSALLRSRVSRVKFEFRSILVAANSYKADTGLSPRMSHFSFYSDDRMDQAYGVRVNGILSTVLSTPIPYLGAFNRLDPFMEDNTSASIDQRFYQYQVLDGYERLVDQVVFWRDAKRFYGEWRIGSSGPDRSFVHQFALSEQLPYDTTNGMVSAGNIWRSPKTDFGAMPPIPLLLSLH